MQISSLHRLFLFVVVLGSLCCASQAQDQPAPDLSGTYAAQGTGDGTKYEGITTLTRHGDTYLISWKLQKEEYEGVGILSDKTLSVGWTDRGKAGVVIYTLSANGTMLDGKWADSSGSGKVFSETLTRKK